MKAAELAPFRHVNWHPNPGDRRGFALSMLVGFWLLGMLAAWRGRDLGQASFILWGIGTVLAVGALVPGLGRLVYLMVYLPTSLLGYLVSHVVLALVFGLLFVPLGLVLRLTGKDLLRLRRPAAAGGAGEPRSGARDERQRRGPGPRRAPSLWVRRGPVPDRERYYRQF
jgi:hypothetical protein